MKSIPWLLCFAAVGGYLYHNSGAPVGSVLYAVVATVGLVCIKGLYFSKTRVSRR